LYELPARIDAWRPRFIVPAIAVVAISAILILARDRFPGGLAAWAHSAAVLAPVSGVVHAGHQLAHDRYSYLSGLGFAVLGGAGIAWVLREWAAHRLDRRVTLVVLATASVAWAGWGAATWRQSAIWRDSETLWRGAVASDPDCSLCLNNLGIAIVRSPVPFDARRSAEAEGYFRRSIHLRPDRQDAYYNLGAVLAVQRRFAEAEPVLTRFMRLFPTNAEGPGRLGMLYVDWGLFDRAVPLLREAIRMNPGLDVARADLRRVLSSQAQERMRLGHPAEAAGLLKEVVLLDPRDATAHFWLARAYIATGERVLAESEIAILQRLDPSLALSAAAEP